MSGPHEYTIVHSHSKFDTENPMAVLIPRIESAKVGSKFDPGWIDPL